MSLLTVNLKHLYQRWTALLLFLVVGGFTHWLLWVFTANGRPGTVPYAAMAAYFLGLLLATLPIEVYTKPFSYCLPGHRTIPVRFLFVTWPVVCLSLALHTLLRPNLELGARIYLLVPTFCAYTIFYWLGAGTVFRFATWGNAFCFFPLAMFALQLLEVGPPLEAFIFSYAWLFVLLAAGAVACAYGLLWRDSLARRYCGRQWLGTYDAWNPDKLAKFRRTRIAEKQAAKKLEPVSSWDHVLLRYITNSDFSCIRRHVLSGLYQSNTAWLLHREEWYRFIAVILPVALFLGYTGAGASIIFIMPVFMVAYMSLHVHSPLLLTGGRRERFTSLLR